MQSPTVHFGPSAPAGALRFSARLLVSGQVVYGAIAAEGGYNREVLRDAVSDHICRCFGDRCHKVTFESPLP